MGIYKFPFSTSHVASATHSPAPQFIYMFELQVNHMPLMSRKECLETMQIRLPKRTKKALGRMAKADGISRSEYIRKVLMGHVEER